MKQWTLLTAAGLSIGLTIAALVGNALMVCAAGAILGCMQAMALRPAASRSWWIAATTIGISAGLALGVVAVEEIGRLIAGAPPHVAYLGSSMRALSFVAIGAVAGTTLGIAQWLVLRVRHWAPICGGALAVAFSAASLLLDGSGTGRIAFVAIAGLLFGALTSWPQRRSPVTT